MAGALLKAIQGDPAYANGQATGDVWNYYATNVLGGQAATAAGGIQMDVCTYMSYVAAAGLPVNLTTPASSGTPPVTKTRGTAQRFSVGAIHDLPIRPRYPIGLIHGRMI
jgi:hypothetical protein